ncbi:hypothetical protein [Chryseobacterium rhizosphaerae]|uniref:hypothetical protein n=1 Tax=Chryseobacterium rhizosphaerae TaxID=395937 RepID=UPI00235A1939|nr:hypothetical protein [Chryseobacterium rhizosphaerae]MDC8099428.1 hypothetical protein [Chryseobacterium rhizosphaerae]
MMSQKYVTMDKNEAYNKFPLETLQKIERQTQFNFATATKVEDNLYLIEPMEGKKSILASKEVYEEMFSNNSFPLFPDNDTPYYRYKELMNKEGFTKENMLKILDEINFNYQKDTFYVEAEKLLKTLSENDRKKLFIPMLYFIGEDLHGLCPKANWNFSRVYYFQPFNEPRLFYKDYSYSFYDLNVLLEEKLLKDKKITFKNIYKRVEKYYLKEKPNWNYTIELVPRGKD